MRKSSPGWASSTRATSTFSRSRLKRPLQLLQALLDVGLRFRLGDAVLVRGAAAAPARAAAAARNGEPARAADARNPERAEEVGGRLRVGRPGDRLRLVDVAEREREVEVDLRDRRAGARGWGDRQRHGQLGEEVVVGVRVDIDRRGLYRVRQLLQLIRADLLGGAAGLLGDLLQVRHDLAHVRVAVDVDRAGAVDVGRSLVAHVREPGLRVDPELAEPARRAVRLVLLRGLRVRRRELLEGCRAQLVSLVLVLDVGVVLGRDQGAVEADARPTLRPADAHREVELGERGRVAGVRLERTGDRGGEVPRLLSLCGSVDAQIELAAGDLGRVVEGLVEDLLWVLAAAAAPASTAGDDGDDGQCDRQHGDCGSDARQVKIPLVSYFREPGSVQDG